MAYLMQDENSGFRVGDQESHPLGHAQRADRRPQSVSPGKNTSPATKVLYPTKMLCPVILDNILQMSLTIVAQPAEAHASNHSPSLVRQTSQRSGCALHFPGPKLEDHPRTNASQHSLRRLRRRLL